MFDPAVRSRIHIMLHYPSPDHTIRRQLWEQKLKPHLQTFKGNLEEALHVVSQYEMNGREISNTVTSAMTIADERLKDMSVEDLQTVLQVWKDSRLVASEEPPNRNRMMLRKMSPWLLRIVIFTLFCGALRVSYIGLRRLKIKLVRLLSGSG
jgi:hypothetical protein